MTDLTVVPIGVEPDKKVESEKVVEIINKAVKDLAEVGIADLAIVAVCEGNSIVDFISSNNQPYTLIGALEALKQNLIADVNSHRVGE